jgi:hypothetical protein
MDEDHTLDVKTLIANCAQGDTAARQEFQQRYGPLIYTFPVRLFRLPQEEAGDFYLYTFAEGRIFNRVKTFAGKNAIHFETYLATYVLKHLFFEWRRTLKQPEIVALDDALPDTTNEPDRFVFEAYHTKLFAALFAQLDVETRLILKLLALGLVEFAEDEVLCLAQSTARSMRETLDVLDQMHVHLETKIDKTQLQWDKLHTVAFWIQTYQRRIAELERQLEMHQDHSFTETAQALRSDKAEIERKLVWRFQQQAKLRREVQKSTIRPSHKDIATLLQVPLPTASAKIHRARKALWHLLDGAHV